MLSFSQYFYYSTLLEAATGSAGSIPPPSSAATVIRPNTLGITHGTTAGAAPRDTRGPGDKPITANQAAGMAARVLTTPLTPRLSTSEIAGTIGTSGFDAENTAEYQQNTGVATAFLGSLSTPMVGKMLALPGMGSIIGRVAASALYDPRAINPASEDQYRVGLTGPSFGIGRPPGGRPTPPAPPSAPVPVGTP